MKNLKNVFKFEVSKLVGTKSFKVTNIIFIALIIIGLSVPTIMNAFGKPLFGDEADLAREEKEKNKEVKHYGVVIEDDELNFDDLKPYFQKDQLIQADTNKELEDLILSEELELGFVINSLTEYTYIVNNTGIYDSNKYPMEAALSGIYRENALASKGLEYGEIEEIYNTPITSITTVLGKDSSKNFFYTYILVFILYFITLVYGQIIATSVTSEKSNRSMEILVTSTSTESLIFGKVLAGALVGIIQTLGLIALAYFTYQLNIKAWDDILDFIFDIPANVIGLFALFAVLGYLLYLFMYATVGALVSKTEDIGTSLTPVMLIFVAAFLISMQGLNSPDTLLVKIASFVPFTSFMTMFVRVAMGKVAIIEIIISLSILAATTIFVGVFAAKIYRLGTLMYGNPIKIKTAIKLLREDKQS